MGYRERTHRVFIERKPHDNKYREIQKPQHRKCRKRNYKRSKLLHNYCVSCFFSYREDTSNNRKTKTNNTTPTAEPKGLSLEVPNKF